MNAKHWDLSHETTTSRFLHYVGRMRLEGKRPVVRFVEPKRSLDQNALIYALYKQIYEQGGGESTDEIRARCKLDYGLPILLRDDSDFIEIGQTINALPYHIRLKAIKYVVITANMSKAQCTEYIETVMREHTRAGYSIILPSDEYGY